MNFNLYYKLYYFTDYYLHLFIMNENDLQIKKNQIYNTRKLKQKNLEDFFFNIYSWFIMKLDLYPIVW